MFFASVNRTVPGTRPPEMIINTGSRTDIPAFFSPWFYNRIHSGHVMVRNPYDPRQVLKYRLSPDVVDCLAFCTKNPGPMLSRIHELDAFFQMWYVTITPYGKEIEPGVPKKADVMESFRRLSAVIGQRSIIWRYDPVFITEKYSLAFHISSFEKMAAALEGSTECCVISFIDLYEKTKRNFPGVRAVRKEERLEIGAAFVRIGKEHGIQIKTCCEGTELALLGADCSGCMTKEMFEHSIGSTLHVPKSIRPAREGCSCLLGSDIGVYNTCSHGCLYCYANVDKEAVRKSCRLHDPASPLLIGRLTEEDQIRDVAQETWLDGQLSLFGFSPCGDL